MTTVKDLQPGSQEVRITSYRNTQNGEYFDGIVKAVTCVNADENVWEVKLYRPAYGNTKAFYPLGSDEVSEPNRNANMAGNMTEDPQRMKERLAWTD